MPECRPFKAQHRGDHTEDDEVQSKEALTDPVARHRALETPVKDKAKTTPIVNTPCERTFQAHHDCRYVK
jgi:hypothetical protein